ncbi:hypothetical protein FQA39_LY03731 [Lamprigera yunnana]|nr:hypothetical protein FQA39_LY03731 [Lamprigera yunnana]
MYSVFILIFGFPFCQSAPYSNVVPYQQRLTFYDNYGRPLPAVGDLISGSDWFPIEINIAEVIGNIANGITTIPTAVTNGFSNVIGFVLKLPIVNRFISGETPRPYVVFIPRSAFAIQDERVNLNTYNGKFHMFSQYP